MAGSIGVRTYRSWPNLQAFYDERGGQFSGESDFGVHNWANPARHRESAFDKWRVSVVSDTADVYAFDYNNTDVLLLGTAVPTEGDSLNADRINARWPLGILHPVTYCAADRLFKGRTENDSLGRPLHWFADRLADQAVS